MTTIKLPLEVAEKFQLVNWTGGHKQLFGKHGIVDLTKITIQQAERLVKNGFTRLKKKEKAVKAASK